MDRNLYLAIGAKVMIIRTVDKSLGLNNGTVGFVRKLEPDTVTVGVTDKYGVEKLF